MDRKLTAVERIVRWAIRRLQRLEQTLSDKNWKKVEG